MTQEIQRAPKLRVSHVVLQLGNCGMEKLLVDFAKYANRKRFELSFVCIGERGPIGDEIAATRWPVTYLDSATGFRPTLMPDLYRALARIGSQVVHTHNNVPHIYGGPAARMAGATVIIHTRHRQSKAMSRRHRAVFQLATLCADRVVCVSPDGLRLSALDGVPEHKMNLVWNGIDLTRFAYKAPTPGGPFVMVGRMTATKGIDTLLQAAAIAVRQQPNFRVSIAGDGEKLSSFVCQARELGVGEVVRFLGDVRDVPGLLATASGFVLPSHREGVSLTLLEAMGRGLPVVTTAVGGNPEIVLDRTTGLLVPPSDPARLAAAMLELWTNPQRSQEMGQLGRDRAVEMFNVRRMIANYEKMYLQIARQKGIDVPLRLPETDTTLDRVMSDTTLAPTS